MSLRVESVMVPIFIRKPHQLSLEIGNSRDVLLGNQAVDRVVEFGRDCRRIRPAEHRADQERCGDMSDVDAVVIERRDHVVGPARDGDENLDVKPLAGKEPFPYCNGDWEGKMLRAAE